MDKKMVRDILKGAENKDLIQIISAMSKKSEEAEQVIIDWCKKNNKDGKKKAIETELRNLWKKAREVISEFNMYGGGFYSDEDEAADAMRKIDEIVSVHDISWEVRVAILDEMMEEFNIGNSGFDDMLIDIASAFCQTDEEKRYLADVLADGTNDYYKGYAANIYKSIGDDEKFLQIKLGNLCYGSDYVQVAKYYLERNDQKKALDQIWQGMKKCEGRLDDLINFAAPIYIKEKNDGELRRMYEFVMKTKWSINIVAVAKQLYHYAKEKEDYDSGKKMLLLILDSCEKGEVEKRGIWKGGKGSLGS